MALEVGSRATFPHTRVGASSPGLSVTGRRVSSGGWSPRVRDDRPTGTVTFLFQGMLLLATTLALAALLFIPRAGARTTSQRLPSALRILGSRPRVPRASKKSANCGNPRARGLDQIAFRP
jgi:hypothetical protein